jgi:hypothetical protein
MDHEWFDDLTEERSTYLRVALMYSQYASRIPNNSPHSMTLRDKQMRCF